MGKNTSVVLGDVQNRFIQEQISKGRFATVSEAVRESISLLEERELHLEHLRRLIDAGEKSGDYQEVDIDLFLANNAQ
ncbi:MAG: type II toxin-antitoxin system ParD family antitoxin [Rhizobiaceae bacterium]